MRCRLHVLVFGLLILVTLPLMGTAFAGERRIAAEDIRQDFSVLYLRLQASHYDLYARRSRADYDRLFRVTLASFNQPMTEFEARIAFQRFVAFGRVAHANIPFPSDAYGAFRDAGGRSFPMIVRVRRGRLFVQQNNSGVAGAGPGDEILSINGLPTAELLARLSAHVSADNDYMMGTLLENRLSPLLWAEFGKQDSFDLELNRAGRTSRLRIPARTRTEVMAAMQGQSGLLDLDWDKREFRMMPGGVGYLRPGPFYNNEPNAVNMWDVTPFRNFIDQAFTSFLNAQANAVVIDLRDNPGGDNSFSDLMVSWYASRAFRFASDFRIRMSSAAVESNAKRVALAPNEADSISSKLASAYASHRIGDVFSFDIPEAQPRQGSRFTGRVYLLQNRHSYSNTVQVTALSQDYGFAKILGQETSDLATTFGAMEQFTLPRTGIEVNFPKALIIRANGNLAARGVVPDIAIETPVVEPASDPVLARALQIALDGR